MTTIVLNVSKLTLLQKLAKGQDIITKSTNNPSVPGNTAALATFVTAQTALTEANAALEAHRQTGDTLLTARDNALATWLLSLQGLAGTTQAITNGNAEEFESAGFDARAERQTPQPVVQVENVKVSFTGMPGHSAVLWKRQGQSDAYVVERSPEPITATSWENVGTVSEAKYEGNGAVPGQKYWYRVAAVNNLGQGPWSMPAERPVM